MQNPIIKLRFDEKLDRAIAWDFYNRQNIGGCDFWKERALKYHPTLINIESTKKSKKEYLNNYISEYYISHSREMKSIAIKTDACLRKKEKNYFSVVNKIFNNYPWPRKKLIGNFSIFDFCPRFLKEGEFQIFIYDNQNLQLFTIFHECLHFIFYDFSKNNFSKTLGKMNTEEGKLWIIAEVFNAVIQDTKDFTDLHGRIKNIGYPDHQKIIKKGAILWKETQDIYTWIVRMKNIIK